MGKPRLAALDPILLGAFPVRAPRRARLRHERLETSELTVDRWVEDLEAVHRSGPAAEPVTLRRHLAGRRDVRRCTRCAIPNASPDWSSTGDTRAAGPGATQPRTHLSGDDRSRPGRVGEGQPDVPAVVHVAIHSRRDAGTTPVVQRPLQKNDHRRGGGGNSRGPVAARHHPRPRSSHGTDARAPRARRRRSSRSKKDGCSRPAFRARSSSSSTPAITCFSNTSRRGAGSVTPCSSSQGTPSTADPAFGGALAARATDSDAYCRRLEQRGDCRAPHHQREDGPQPHVASLRQTRRLDARAGHRLRARAPVRGLKH